MAKSYMARILATVSVLPLALATAQSAAQSTDPAPVRTFGASSAELAAADVVEVGITDVVERQALGTLQETTRNLRITDTIFFNERIATGPDSATRVSFLDDSSLSLGPSSEVVIDRFIYDPADGTGEMALSLTAGVFRFASGTLDSENYTIDTPVGTIGVRGTVFEVEVSCAQRAVGDCQVIMDVISGWTVFGDDDDDDETVTPTGSRLSYRPAVSDQVEVAVLPDDAARLPGLEDLGARLNQSTVDLLNGALPPGVSFAAATPEQLAQAAVTLARGNPRLGDLLVESIIRERPDALGAVSSLLMSTVPATTRRVIGTLALAQAASGPAGDRQGRPFGDDDLRDNPLAEEVPDETPPDDEPPPDDDPPDDPPDDDPPDDDPPDDPPDDRSDRFDDIRDRLDDTADRIRDLR